MRSRPLIFVGLITSIVVVAGVLGTIIFKQSQSAAPKVAEQNRQYQQQKKEQTQQQDSEAVANYQTNDVAPLAEDSSVSGTDQTNTAPQDSVQVFFSKNPESNRDSSAVFPVARVTNGKSPGNVAMSELIIGPTAQEKAEGFMGGFQLAGDSNCEGKDFVLKQDSEENVTLQLCRKISSASKLVQQQYRSQIVTTLSTLTSAENITLYDNEGNCLFALNTSPSCTLN